MAGRKRRRRRIRRMLDCSSPSGLSGQPTAKRCTQLSLQAFGIHDPDWTKRCVRTGADVMSLLREHGWSYRPVYVEGKPTVAKFLRDHPRGKFVLSSRGHSMAVVDGKLYDLSGGSKRQRVLTIAEVYQPGQKPIYEPFSTWDP